MHEADTSFSRSILETLNPAVQPHIYEYYDGIRSEGGVYWDQQLGAWLVTERDLVQAGLVDRNLSSVRYTDIQAVDAAVRPLIATLGKQLFYLDPPDHPRIRGLMNRAFSARSISALRAQIEQTTNVLLDAMAEKQQFDLVAD